MRGLVAQPRIFHQLPVPAAFLEESGEPARQGLYESVGTRLKEAGCNVDVVVSENWSQLLGIHRGQDLNITKSEPFWRVANKCVFIPGEVQVVIQPLEGREAFPISGGPRAGEQLDFARTRAGLPLQAGEVVENGVVHGVVDDAHRVLGFVSEHHVHVVAPLGLKYRRARKLLVDLENSVVLLCTVRLLSMNPRVLAKSGAVVRAVQSVH
mmetsp:Transcript_30884/g.42801  ORF Transcript_30884/g.42801 Transcript_30884/m.42801 type:complete len:210 (-) Transcript_30884:473-1102(-)